MSNKNYDCKHLTTTQRIKIEKGLLDGESFASIARNIEKHPSTVAKEVRKYRYFPVFLKTSARFASFVIRKTA